MRCRALKNASSTLLLLMLLLLPCRACCSSSVSWNLCKNSVMILVYVSFFFLLILINNVFFLYVKSDFICFVSLFSFSFSFLYCYVLLINILITSLHEVYQHFQPICQTQLLFFAIFHSFHHNTNAFHPHLFVTHLIAILKINVRL